jgi:ketosteroid isomerase-like protein
MTKNDDRLEQFMKIREEAARAYVNGDAGPLGELMPALGPATFFGPDGGSVGGVQAVFSRYASDATHFQKGSETHFEVLQFAASDSVAYWTGLQHAVTRMKGNPEPAKMSLRVTELFRKEDNGWKLVHRHADMLKA